MIIDSHIHFDKYTANEMKEILNIELLEALISVSFHKESCIENLALSKQFPKVKPAFGYHPEQSLPNDSEITTLMEWIRGHQEQMVAIGEVGLPYYKKNKGEVTTNQYYQYINLLEIFIKLAKELDKPIVLHAVYDDAPIVCDLLEKYSIKKAHFHWFKGDPQTISRMATNGYFISVTPDVTYKENIKDLVYMYPLQQIMVETDGPWPFEGEFEGQLTNPLMMVKSLNAISEIKSVTQEEVQRQILHNTKLFYSI